MFVFAGGIARVCWLDVAPIQEAVLAPVDIISSWCCGWGSLLESPNKSLSKPLFLWANGRAKRYELQLKFQELLVEITTIFPSRTNSGSGLAVS